MGGTVSTPISSASTRGGGVMQSPTTRVVTQQQAADSTSTFNTTLAVASPAWCDTHIAPPANAMLRRSSLPNAWGKRGPD